MIQRSIAEVVTTVILALNASGNNNLQPLFIHKNASSYTLPSGVQSFASPYSVDTTRRSPSRP